jgi:hypothetical protein
MYRILSANSSDALARAAFEANLSREPQRVGIAPTPGSSFQWWRLRHNTD